MKFYKYRIKIQTPYRLNKWISSDSWLLDHAILYVNRSSNIEFDWKILSGFVLYQHNHSTLSLHSSEHDISQYMKRSYNWKYLT